MIKKGFGKRGEGLLMSNVIFILLNLLFLFLLLAFVYRVSSGAPFYEQSYAKQIALSLDSAKTGMTIFINFEKGLEIAEKNNQNKNDILNIDNEENIITIKLDSKGGYQIKFFSDNKILYGFMGEKLLIQVREGSSQEDVSSEGLSITKFGENPTGGLDVNRKSDDLEKAINYAIQQGMVVRECIDYKDFIEKYAEQEGFDSLLVLALFIQESACDQERVSGSDAFGLGQITNNPGSKTFDSYCKGIVDDFDLVKGKGNEENNIACSVKILESKGQDFGGDVTLEKLSKCSGCCKDEKLLKKYSEYEGVEIALRGYVGWVCEHPNYVESVLKTFEELNLAVKDA